MPLIKSRLLRYPIEALAVTSLARVASRYIDRYNRWLSEGEPEAWYPSVEVFDRHDAFVIRTELPDVKPEDVDVTVADKTINIEGERRPPTGYSPQDVEDSELYYGSFSKSVELPGDIQAEAIEATLGNGMLEIRAPKLASQKPLNRVVVKLK